MADYYDAAFANHPNIKTPARATYSYQVYHQYTLQIEGDRNALREHLAALNIPSMIYYPIPAHKQKAFDGRGKVSGQLKVTDWLTDRVISLPIHTEMDEEQLKFIVDGVKSFFK